MFLLGRVLRKSEKAKTVNKSLRSAGFSAFILLLSAAIMFIFISMVLQMLNAGGGERVQIPDQPQARAQLQTPTQTPTQPETATRKTLDVIRVEVLNGCGANNIAADLREFLIARDFDVVDFKNFSSYQVPQTMVIDRTNMEQENAKKVARVIGVSKNHVFPQISPHRKLDVTVIIGHDYKNLKAFQ